MAFLDSSIPMKQAIVAIGVIITFVFSLGQIQERFSTVETTLDILLADEEKMATKEELEVLDQRVTKKIQIQNDQDDLLHELELELIKLRTEYEYHVASGH